VRQPGKFAGIIDKIPYLQDLGITAVELMPIFDFDETDARIVDGQRLPDFWGYSTLGFFGAAVRVLRQPGIRQPLARVFATW